MAEVYRAVIHGTESFDSVAVPLAYLLGALATEGWFDYYPEDPSHVALLTILEESLPRDHAVWAVVRK